LAGLPRLAQRRWPGKQARFARVRAVAVLAVVASCLVAPHAHAFEREWHLGGGVGGALVPTYPLGLAANVYAAYGLSDAFDVRAELWASFHEGTLPNGVVSKASYGSGKLALTYKIDVIQWIPWVGVGAGVLTAGTGGAPFDSAQATLGAIAGLDYAWTRNFGLGLCFSLDYGFTDANTYGAGFLRAEYHFGW
jgi:hypothetical protein